MIPKRIEAFRAFMDEHGLHAFIIPSSDPHLSEYPASHWASREWISGFTGSAGTVVLTREKAGLWTDSRYFLQAETELKGSGIDLFKEGLPSTPSYTEWIINELKENNNVGIDGNVFSSKEALTLASTLKMEGIGFITQLDPFASIWGDRPEIPTNPLFSLPVEFSGKSTGDKIKDVQSYLTSKQLDSILVASLDTIAWLFNIRGNDVKCNPVAVAYAYISQTEAILFVDPKKLTHEVHYDLQKGGVTIGEYSKIVDFISSRTDKRICISSNKLSFALYDSIPKTTTIIDIIPSPIDLMKSKKNEVEIEGFRNAMTRDGVALVQFLMWLEKSVASQALTELDIVHKLVEYRSQQAHYVGESFDTIAGYMGNGAIVHYHVSPNNPAKLKAEGLVLVDSGAQYFDGTTDITRTIALGALTDEMKTDYTLVLKGHIALALAKYPQGTRGSQLDILARQFLWNNSLNYLHGTGHGIGHFLNVHEGPQSIRMDENSTVLEIGMITSNEPGLYRANKHGIRIENLILTQKDSSTEFGEFYSFETLTLCPIDTTPIVKDLMTEEELKWLNDYHKTVYEKLSPTLSDEEKNWLKDKTKEI